MPRLDNSSLEVQVFFELQFDPADPGATNPVDVCWGCGNDWPEELRGVVHPSYEEQSPPYVCANCGEALCEEDNLWNTDY